MTRSIALRTLAVWLLGVTLTSAAEFSREQLEHFEKHIRPLLASHCYECHSGRAKRLEAGLRLDGREFVLKGGDSGPAIVPGRPMESLLVEAVRYESFEMPPRGRLKKTEIDALVKWVEMGAPWPDEPHPVAEPAATDKFDWPARKEAHWSWQPIRKVNPPPVRNESWCRGPIDRFILHSLEENRLSPSVTADKRTLVRRLYFDLIGLPPTPAQVAQFVQDDSPDAYTKLVDALLASEHFGEKWARHWMDLVRFAETHGHEFDYPIKHAWRYRDYLIRAFNADVPYDQLVTEHIAGDLLPVDRRRRHPTEGFDESILGTGFWFLGEATHAPTDVRGDEALRIDNQIDVFSKTFLGLTVACARCHDHKFDPIPTTDYYALAGFLQSMRKDEARLDPGGEIAEATVELQDLFETGSESLRDTVGWLLPVSKAEMVENYLLAAREVCLKADERPSDKAIADVAHKRGLDTEQLTRWIRFLSEESTGRPDNHFAVWAELLRTPDSQFAQRFAQWRNAIRQQVEQANAQRKKGRLLSDQSWFNDIDGGGKKSELGQWDLSADRLQFLRPLAWHSGGLSDKTHGTLRSPTFELTHDKIHLRMKANGITVRLIVDGYQMEPFSSLLFGGTRLAKVDTKGQWQWLSLGNTMYKGHQAYLEFLDEGDGEFSLDEAYLGDGAPPERFGLFNLEVAKQSADTPAELADRLGKEWLSAVHHWEDHNGLYAPETTVTLNSLLAGGVLKEPPELEPLRQGRREIEKLLPQPMRVLAAADGTGENEHVFIRGSHQNLGDVVPRRLLIAIAGENQPYLTPEDGSGRLQLAQRLLDETNPFPARVMVNRLWHHLFGQGIVPSVDDFGVMGLPPTHPELLDWLAADFREHGWSIKHAIRQIVLSATYRQASGMRRAESGEPGTGSPLSLDPANRLLWRQNVRRLPAEAVRDAILAVSGRLAPTAFGPSVPVHLTPFMQGRGRPGKSGPLDGNGRRSVYLEVRRNFLTPMLTTFDFPQPFSTMGRRTVSNVPAQALVLMNDPFVAEQARVWAERLLATYPTTDARLHSAFVEIFACPPSSDQLAQATEFLKRQASAYGTSPEDSLVWADLCHVLFNMKAFVYLH